MTEMTGNIKITLIPSPYTLYIIAPDENPLGDSGKLAELLSKIKISGARIDYGINKIPVATVTISPANLTISYPEALKLFCDFDSIRRQAVQLTIHAVKDCLVFEGIIDGMSLSQQPGSMTASLILKHRFALLTEIYPRGLGYNAGTTNIFAIQQCIKFDSKFTPETGVTNVQEVGKYFNYYADNISVFNLKLNLNQPPIPLMVDLCRALVKGQNGQGGNNLTFSPQMKQALNQSLFTPILKAVQINAQKMAPTILDMLDNIYTTHAEGLSVPAICPVIGQGIINNIALLENTLFHGLIRMLSEYNCNLILANNSAYTVPDAQYLKINDKYGNNIDKIKTGTRSDQYNVALPADYENYTFHDGGDNTVKGVYVVPDTLDIHTFLSQGNTDIATGFYGEDLNIDDKLATESTGNAKGNKNKVFGNIVVKTFPTTARSYVGPAAVYSTLALRNKIAGKPTSFSSNTKQDAVDLEKAMNDTAKNQQNLIDLVRDFMNQWAQTEYCRIKYGGRTGSINLVYNNNWVPGAPGRLYTRNPGMLIDFFVTDVSHNFSIAAPNNASATTSVSFNSGRPWSASTQLNNGLDKLKLFDYNYDSSLRFCKDFITDIGSDFKL